MSRIRLILLAIVMAAGGFLLGLLWRANDPKPEVEVPGKRLTWNAPESLPHVQDKALLALLASGQEANGSVIYNFVIFNHYSAIWRDYAKSAQSPVILEIGPGSNLGQGMLFVAAGAKKYTGLDLFQSLEVYHRTGYAAAYELLKLVAPERVRVRAEQIFSVEGDRVVFKPERMEYLYPRQSYDLRLPDGSVDFVFSHSVLEHVSDPDKTMKAIAKVLRSGGISAHHFDLRDHTDFSKPLEFLKLDESSWQARAAGQNGRHTNRKRLSDFVNAIESAGLKIRKLEPTARITMTEAMRKKLHPDFWKYGLEDLAVVSALIVAEKP